jgi:hypothetical protein
VNARQFPKGFLSVLKKNRRKTVTVGRRGCVEAQKSGVKKRTGSGVVFWVEGDTAHCYTIAFLFDISQGRK